MFSVALCLESYGFKCFTHFVQFVLLCKKERPFLILRFGWKRKSSLYTFRSNFGCWIQASFVCHLRINIKGEKKKSVLFLILSIGTKVHRKDLLNKFSV